MGGLGLLIFEVVVMEAWSPAAGSDLSLAELPPLGKPLLEMEAL